MIIEVRKEGGECSESMVYLLVLQHTCIPGRIPTSMPPIFFDHVGYLYDELAFLVLLTGLEGMFLDNIIMCEIRLNIIRPRANKYKNICPPLGLSLHNVLIIHSIYTV